MNPTPSEEKNDETVVRYVLRDVDHVLTRSFVGSVKTIGSYSGHFENSRNFRWNCDRLPAQAMTERPEELEFRSLYDDRIAVQADQFLDHPTSHQLGGEPLGPFRQDRQSEAHRKTVQDELRRIVVQDRSPRAAVGTERG